MNGSRLFFAAVIFAALGVFAARTGWAQDAVAGSYTTLRCPQAALTVAVDINDSGTITGRCVIGGVTHGFIYEPDDDGATYTMFDFPGAARTEGWGINERGDVIGQYLPPGEVRLRGFIRSASGAFVTIDRPGEFHVMPEDLNNAGFAVGCMHNDGTMHGWISKGIEPVSVGPAYEMYTGVNESGTLVGWSWPTRVDGSFGFVRSGLGRTEIRYPAASNTQVWGVNQYGHVVGWFGPSTGGTGFLLREGQFASVAVPGAAWTRAFGINSTGMIVGAYRSGSTTSGFLFIPAGE